MEIIAYASIFYLAVRLIITVINLCSASILRVQQGNHDKEVAVLIPARNEEKNIGQLLDDLTASDYPHLSIFVYDDESTDKTAEIIKSKAEQDQRIEYLKGERPGTGWLGKNYACHRLSQEARGYYYLFIDADVRVGKTLISSAVSRMEEDKTALLSIFPVQLMFSLGEWLSVPLVNRILVGNLPLVLVRRSHIPGFSAANGQFMMFNADIYRRYRFHDLFRAEKVEDIRIIRFMKNQRLPVETLLSDGQVKCRMYRGFGDSMNGFAKNVHAFFGRNWFVLFIYIFLSTAGPFASWQVFGETGLIICLAGLILFSTLVTLQSKQKVFLNIFLMPLQQVTLLMIAMLALFRYTTGTLKWKGRKI